MPKMVLTAAFLAVNAIDRSDWLSKIEITTEVDEKDVTTFKSLGWKEVQGGLKSGSVAPTFRNDVDPTTLDAAMWALLGNVVPFEVRASQAVRSAANPGYTGSMLVKSWTPITGSPGDVNESSYTWPTSGPVARATA